MNSRMRDQWLGVGFLTLGIGLLLVAITSQRAILGTGLCIALGALFLVRAQRAQRD